jgi:hypothetical protein
MTAPPGYIDGELQIREYGYQNSTSERWSRTWTCVRGVVVDHFVGLIYENKRHLYNMSGGGSGVVGGCKSTIIPLLLNTELTDNCSYVAMSDFANCGYLENKNAANELYPDLLKLYSSNNATRDLAMVRGEFVEE